MYTLVVCFKERDVQRGAAGPSTRPPTRSHGNPRGDRAFAGPVRTSRIYEMRRSDSDARPVKPALPRAAAALRHVQLAR